MFTLYHSPLQAHCRKTRLLMREYGLEMQLENEPYWEKRAEFMYLNPGGDVPVLQEGDGLLAVGNYAITEHLLEYYTPARGDDSCLLGQNPALRCEVRRLVDWFDRKFYQEVTRPLVYERYFKPLEGNGPPDSHAMRQGRRHLVPHLELINALTEQDSFLVGDRLTLADLAAAAQISCIDYFGEVLWSNTRYAALRRWYGLVKSRPSMRHILTDRIRSQAPPPYYENPDF